LIIFTFPNYYVFCNDTGISVNNHYLNKYKVKRLLHPIPIEHFFQFIGEKAEIVEVSKRHTLWVFRTIDVFWR